jgi:hypothetical protein
LDQKDWGHDKRAKGVRLAGEEFLGFFNDDDLYDREYVQRMLEAVEEGYDAAFCNWSGRTGVEFKLGSSTSGNFIVRTKLARTVGYNHRVYEADGLFIDDLRAAGAWITKVEKDLYTHNAD